MLASTKDGEDRLREEEEVRFLRRGIPTRNGQKKVLLGKARGPGFTNQQSPFPGGGDCLCPFGNILGSVFSFTLNISTLHDLHKDLIILDCSAFSSGLRSRVYNSPIIDRLKICEIQAIMLLFLLHTGSQYQNHLIIKTEMSTWFDLSPVPQVYKCQCG